MKKALCLALSFILLLVCLGSCGGEIPTDENTDGLKIVTTVFSIYDWTRTIKGDEKNIKYLQGSGSDMHSYEPSANDLISLKNADLFIFVGGESDKWTDKALESIGNENLKVLRLIDLISPLDEQEKEGMQKKHSLFPDEDEEDEKDEHIWLSLKNAKICTKKISDTLCELDRENSKKYGDNLEKYVGKIDEMFDRYKKLFSEKENKTIVVADRFPFLYLTDEFGLDYFAAFKGCSAESEASFETVKFLTKKTTELCEKYIFVLENSNTRLADSVASSTGTNVLKLDSLQSVSDDEKSKNYLETMEKNLDTILSSLT